MSWFRTLGRLRNNTGRSEVFRDFVTMAACALSVGSREAEYLEVTKRYSPEDLALVSEGLGELIQSMEASPYTDLLGPVYIEHFQSRSQRQGMGEFYTPQELCRLCAEMTITHLPDQRPVTLLEPCSGAGAMVLSMAERLKESRPNSKGIARHLG